MEMQTRNQNKAVKGLTGEGVDGLLRQKLNLCRLLSESSSEAVRDDCDIGNRDAVVGFVER